MFFKIIDPVTLRIEHTYEAEARLEWGGPWNQYPHIAVPEGMDKDCVKCEITSTEIITVVDAPERTIPAVLDADGNEVTPEQTIPAVTRTEERPVLVLVEDAGLLAAKAIADKNALVSEAYNRMDKDILSYSKTLYGSGSSEAMLAWEAQWTRMANSPEAFVGKMGFTTAEQVVAYAHNKISNVSIPAGLYRLDRIEQFISERDAILAT